jgi:drug/metabolite transporter (DMT)-like permease
MAEQENRKKTRSIASLGFLFAILVLIGDGFQTIITNSRPGEVSSFLFSWLSACVELMLIFPIFLFSRLHKRKKTVGADAKIYVTRSQIVVRLSVVGVIFAACSYYVIVGFTLVDSVTGILAVKTQPISMIIIGAIFLKERLSIQEIAVAACMLGLITFIITKGTFDLGNLSIGVVYLLIVPVFWNIGHSVIKPLLTNEILTVPEFAFIRIAFTAVILGIVFLITGKRSDLVILSHSGSLLSIFSMGALFATIHLCWYHAVRALPLSIATFIVIPSPVVTAILTFLITHERLYYYHYVGTAGVIIGLYAMISFHKKNKQI